MIGRHHPAAGGATQQCIVWTNSGQCDTQGALPLALLDAGYCKFRRQLRTTYTTCAESAHHRKVLLQSVRSCEKTLEAHLRRRPGDGGQFAGRQRLPGGELGKRGGARVGGLLRRRDHLSSGVLDAQRVARRLRDIETKKGKV